MGSLRKYMQRVRNPRLLQGHRIQVAIFNWDFRIFRQSAFLSVNWFKLIGCA